MPRPSRIHLRLQSLVLLVLLPGLLLSTALFGWSIYRGVYGIILDGFDRKLHAVSTVTGAFIRGEDHDTLFEPRAVVALAAGGGDELLGIDASGGALVAIDPEEGGALEVAALPGPASALAVDAGRGMAWVSGNEDAALLYRIDLASGAAERVSVLDRVPAGLAYDARLGLLYAGGEELTAIDPSSGRSHALLIDGLSGPVRAPAIDPASNTLYLLHEETAELVAVDLHQSRARRVDVLHEVLFEENGEGDGVRAPFTPHIHGLAVGEGGQIYGISDRLVRIDPATAVVDSAESAVGFRSSQHPLYQQYVGPMRRIMAKQNISYLYTETVGLGGVLTYGIDATEGENHSIIGSTESISDEELPAMERAMVRGQVRLSEIENWGAWGLLKTADAPIYREDGEIAALAAADVDISLILEKTRVALLKVGIVAAITLLLGALVSFLISRRLVSPLTEVKEGALQLAAGQYGHRIADQELLELRELSESFNSMSEALADTLGELTKTNQALETVRRGRALEVALGDVGHEPEPSLPFLVERSESRLQGVRNPSGYAGVAGERGERLLVWIADPVSDSPLENLRLRREVAALARAVLAESGEDPGAGLEFLGRIFPELRCLVVLDGSGRRVQAFGRRATPMVVVGAEGAMRTIDLSLTPYYEVGDSECVVVAAGDPEAAMVSLRRERLGAAIFSPGARLDLSRRPAESPSSPLAVAMFGRALLAGSAMAGESMLEVVVGGV